MPEPRQPLESTHYYHIYNHAVGKENLFERDQDYTYFLSKMKEYLPPVTDMLAYCLQPNHFHLVIRIKTKREVESYLRDKLGETKFKNQNSREYFLDEQLSKIYSNLFNTYAKHFNFVMQRTGSLFKRACMRKKIESTEYLRTLICYIHQNPVEAGFAKKPDDWKYSSYSAITTQKQTLVMRNEVKELFGGLDNFLYCHRQYAEIKLEL